MIRIFAVADNHHHFSHGIQTYLQRLHRDVELVLVPPFISKNIGETQQRETRKIVDRLDRMRDVYVIALSDNGDAYDTHGFEQFMSAHQLHSKHIIFLLGGAYGFDTQPLREHVNVWLSLSPLTMTHGLALLVLLEQLYRIQQIRRNTSYHH